MNNELKAHRVSLINGLWINDWEYNSRILAVFVAIEILLAYSPFGFIILPSISITTLFIGVLVAALWGGPVSGAAVGLVFGLNSMWKASVTAINPSDLIFSPVQSGSPLNSIILAVGSRVLFGAIAGLAYYIIMKFIPRRSRLRFPSLLIVSVLLERVHSSLVYLFMDKLFHVEGVSIAKAWTGLFSAHHLQTYIVTMMIVACAYLLYDRFLSKQYYRQFTQIEDIVTKFSLKYSILIFLALLIVLLTSAHLWERIQIVLFDINQLQPEMVNVELIAQIIFQYMLATMAAAYIVIVIYRHARSIEELERTRAIVQLDLEKEKAEVMEQHALRDSLTGVYNRKGLEKIVAEEHLDNAPTGYLLIDIDHFKEINDNFGHDMGDIILKETSKMLVEFFGENRVFRLGGDEFSVLTGDGKPCSQERLQAKWDAMIENFGQMHKRLSNILPENMPVTFSVGVCFSETGYNDKLYPLADIALYETKTNGRAGCTLVDKTGKVMETWRDFDTKTNAMLSEFSQIGVYRMLYSLDGTIRPQLFCSDDIRSLMCVPMDASPEQCYEIWVERIAQEYSEEMKKISTKFKENGCATFEYVWNHPLRGKIHVENGATSRIKDSIVSVLGHYQLHFDEEQL